MIGWLKRSRRPSTTTHEAEQAVNRVRQEKREVDDLVSELKARREQNKFAPRLETALGVVRGGTK